MTRSKTCYFPFNVNCFFCQSLYSTTLIQSQSRMINITFCSLSFRSTVISLIMVSFWFILPYSVVIPPRYIPVPFLFKPSHSSVIPPCSGIFRFICVSFHLIPVSFQLVPVYPGTILVHSVSLRCHSTSFQHIPVYSVPFLCLVTPTNKCLSSSLVNDLAKMNADIADVM